MSKHTKGPWALEELHWRSMQTANGSRCVAFITAGRENVADVCDSAGMTEEEARANARLIAAAPTMHDYIQVRANDGDKQALSILEAINACR
jgi:hypothetical protein